MNKNIENYKKALNELKADKNLKEKTLNNILKFCNTKIATSNKKHVNSFDKNNLNKNVFKKFKIATYSLTTVLTSVVIIFSVVFINNTLDKNNIQHLALQDANSPENISKIEEKDILPKVGSIDNLNKILESMNLKNNYSTINSQSSSITLESADISKDVLYKDSDYSQTNTQVGGVDEADIVKTDGNYIYYIANKKIYIVNAKYPHSLKIETVLEYEENILPKELYIRDNKMVAILNKSDINIYNNNNSTISYDIAYYDTDTIIITYDIRNKSNLLEKRKIEIDGNYIDSRMINNEVYVVTTKNIYKNEQNILPVYKDTAKDTLEHEVSVEEMLYVPETKDTSYLMIVGFSVDNDNAANIKTILGTGHDIYCTQDNLYITYTKYDEPVETYHANGIVSISAIDIKYYTHIYKFKLQDSEIISTATTKVNGRTLNQFSMGEYNKNFSIVTTEDTWDENNTRSTKNILYVLNENLEQIGVLDNIANGENLYAVRFIKDKAYVVTFKQVDPLFVIDISNPANPEILGELKIPGYSSYLHPYDDTHIIGIGQDVEIEQTKYGERTKIKGVKISLFDVSDYTNPKELHSLILNDKSYTNASYDHKAILFSKDKNILAFPMSSYSDDENRQEYVILSISPENGISTRTKIDHGYETTEYGKYMRQIYRGLYIDNYLYTLSDNNLQVTNLDTYEKVGEIQNS